MGLVAVFVLVWLLVALPLRLAAERALGPARRSRPLWREGATLLAFSGGFLVAWVLYRAFTAWYLFPRYAKELEGLRVAAQDCGAQYSRARTVRDSAAVDTMHPVADVRDPNSVLTCGTLRKS